MRCTILAIFVAGLTAVIGAKLGKEAEQNLQNSLFNLFEHLGSALNRNQTGTEDKSGNSNLLIINNLSLNISLNINGTGNDLFAKDSELLERIVKLEKMAATLLQNQKSLDDQINVLTSNANNTQIASGKTPEVPAENPLDPCKTATESGVYKLKGLKRKVYCETETFDGGWLVFQQRRKMDLDFDRKWMEYRTGFGVVGKDTDFWVGLETIHRITSAPGADYELAIEMTSEYGRHGDARYAEFRVASEKDGYRLSVGEYFGVAGDGLRVQNNMKFTTNDRDNDNYETDYNEGNCAVNKWSSGWWYNKCIDESAPNYRNIHWPGFIYPGTKGKFIRMMIRQKE